MLMHMIADSEIGVSTTRISPNSSYSPCVTPNAPPYAPTSSPRTKTFGSRRISSTIASRMASRYESSLLIPGPLHHEDTKYTKELLYKACFVTLRDLRDFVKKKGRTRRQAYA